MENPLSEVITQDAWTDLEPLVEAYLKRCSDQGFNMHPIVAALKVLQKVVGDTETDYFVVFHRPSTKKQKKEHQVCRLRVTSEAKLVFGVEE